jgi:CO/xanthine dehydrogenase Mo-binding subunit
MEKRGPVGASTTYIEGRKKVTGNCWYTFDLKLPDMLVGKALYPDYPHARITKLDTSAAEAIPGVKAVVTHQDIPGEKICGYLNKDQPVFAIDEVHYIGDIVAAVAAVSEEVADAALKEIEVEYEPLPGVFDAIEAMKVGAPLARSNLESNILAHIPIVQGDPEKGFVEADVIVEKTYRTQCMDQFCMEPEGAIAEWDGETLTIHACGQYPHRDRFELGEVLNLPLNRVRVIYPYVGGGFGAKDEVHVQFCVGLLAMKAKQPVKLVRSRHESMSAHVKRQAVFIRYKTGAKADGTITAIEATLVGDAGPYTNATSAVMGFAAEMASGCYKIPNAKIDSYVVATNNQAGGAMRGFGGPEIGFAQEQNMDLLAEKLGMDPLELRLKNGMEKDTLMPTGAYIYNEIGLKETMRRAAEESRWYERDQWLEREPAPGLRRGLGVASAWHGVGIGRDLLDQSNTSLEMTPDGTVLLYSGTTEYGSGAHSAQAIIAAENLGVRVEDVKLVTPDTHVTPDAGVTSASRSTYMMGNAILRATDVIRKSLLEVASDKLETIPEDIEMVNGEVWARSDPDRVLKVSALAHQAWVNNKQLRADGFYKMWQPEKPKAKLNYPFPHSIFGYATQIVQVLVDTETGQVTLEKVWAAHDVGKVINMLGVEGQIDGGIVQGMGSALMEELQQEEGRLMNGSLEGYVLPMSVNTPEIIPIIVEVPEPTGPYGAKGVGEIVMTPVASAIANAIYDATGVRPDQIPITAERMRTTLNEGRQT